MNQNAQRILESLRDCPVIDTHEHLDDEARQPSLSALHDYTRHYFACDLISAGMDPGVVPKLADDLPAGQKWSLLEPFWAHCRSTGYGRMLDLAARKLYGVEEINAGTIDEVERGFQAMRAKPGYGRRILESCRIEHCMDNVWHLEGDDLGGMLWFVTQIDRWVLFEREALAISDADAENIRDIDDWVALCLETLQADFDRRNAKALKMAVAYARSLSFDLVARSAAQADFQAFRRGLVPGKAAQDYVLHRILHWADGRGLILQVHTGYQEGNGNLIGNTNPEHLNPLFSMYPNIRFDLFHMGYPYHHFMGALGKMYPNVRLDMCWAHILSPGVAQSALYEWLGGVPANKIFAFGGDCLFFDGVVGHLELAKRNVAAALGRCVDDVMFTPARAERVARMLFYDNPREFYGM